MDGNPKAPFRIGDCVTVGAFFWTDERRCIGFDYDAKHGHELWFGGSVDVGDYLIIRGIEGHDAVVRVNKHHLPCGAMCPHGMVFSIPLAQMALWPGDHARRTEVAEWRAGMSHYLLKNDRYGFDGAVE